MNPILADIRRRRGEKLRQWAQLQVEIDELNALEDLFHEQEQMAELGRDTIRIQTTPIASMTDVSP
jgi:hypothetical protein